MKKILIILSALVLAASCKAIMEPIRVQMDGTYWSYSTEDQTARVVFPDDSHVSILQLDMNSGYTQSLDGTYYTDGHSTICNGKNWPSTIKFVRTFTHLKNNSTNKNLTPLEPQSWSSVDGSIWALLQNENFHLAYFRGGNCYDGTYANVTHEEGLPYGWNWKKLDYELTGSQIKVGKYNGTLFDRFMVVDSLAVMVSTLGPKSTGTSALTGTVWQYDAAVPGVIIFTSDVDFTRVIVSSKIIHEVKAGTYKLDGANLNMELDGKKETCQIQGGRFTLFNKAYVKITLP